MIHDEINEYTLKLVEKYGVKIIRRSLMSLRNFDLIFKYIIEDIKKEKKVLENGLETGTFRGVTTGYIAKEFQNFYTFDNEQQINEIKDYNIVASQIFKFLNANNIIYNKFKNEEQKHENIRNINNLDFCLLDGGSEEEIIADFKLCESKCKHILIHDATFLRREKLFNFLMSLPKKTLTFFYNNNFTVLTYKEKYLREHNFLDNSDNFIYYKRDNS